MTQGTVPAFTLDIPVSDIEEFMYNRAIQAYRDDVSSYSENSKDAKSQVREIQTKFIDPMGGPLNHRRVVLILGDPEDD